MFEGRDQLLAFLTSNNTTDLLILGLVKGMIEGARTLHAAGFSFDGIDAIGMRVSGGGGLILGGGGSADIVLNTRAGQFSAFISGQAGAVFGETALATGGIVLIANLPTNDGLRDAFEQVGIYGGDIVGIDVDVSWSAPMADSYDPRDKANAGSIGAGGAVPGIAVYGMIGYSWEALRVDVSGMHWAPHRPSIQDVVNSVTDAFVHDVVKSPIWQQPR